MRADWQTGTRARWGGRKPGAGASGVAKDREEDDDDALAPGESAMHDARSTEVVYYETDTRERASITTAPLASPCEGSSELG